MFFFRLIFSKVFIKQLIYILFITFLLFMLVIYGLQYFTNHNIYIKVPNLEFLSLEETSNALKDNGLRFEVLDSTKYNPAYKPLTVIDQSPKFNDLVKKNRKIYITLNPSSYRELSVPNVIQITKRNAQTMLTAVGFKIGKIIYVNNIGKDMVIEIKFQGEKIKPGILLPKNSYIDLVLGNGKK